VEYFERSRFEYHPEAAGTPQVVQLTNVGRIITAGRTDPRIDSAFPPQPLIPAGPDRSYYVQTQHSIGGQFKKFFDQNGGTFIFGYPISEETIEANPTDGVAYTVQWFERARFEFHPEFNDTPNAIELGQLGRQLLLGQLGVSKPQCSPLYIQKPLLPECR
jgi:polysaccharide biosynthesis protein PslG